MIPIEQVRKKIPADALTLFEKYFGPSVVNQLLLAFRTERRTSFRINPLRGGSQETIERLRSDRFKISNIPFIPGAYQLDRADDNRLLKTEAALSGQIYLQSISSMLPVTVLDPRPGEKVLDLAASPGSKTTQMAALMKNQGQIDAIEPDFIRYERLKHNIELQGALIVHCFQDEGQKFTLDKPGLYDRILADVPCSGEGRFSIHDRNTYGTWKLNELPRFARLQKKLLKAALFSLKPGGTLVYSTCTLNPFENEGVVDEILNDPDIKAELAEINPAYHQFKEKIKILGQADGKVFSKELSRCLKILPSENMEGFFICKIIKR